MLSGGATFQTATLKPHILGAMFNRKRRMNLPRLKAVPCPSFCRMYILTYFMPEPQLPMIAQTYAGSQHSGMVLSVGRDGPRTLHAVALAQQTRAVQLAFCLDKCQHMHLHHSYPRAERRIINFHLTGLRCCSIRNFSFCKSRPFAFRLCSLERTILLP